MILPLEQQVTSREISEELKKRGVSQDSLFYHCYEQDWGSPGKWSNEIRTKTEMDTFSHEYGNAYEVFCSAYTLPELFYFLSKNPKIVFMYNSHESTIDDVARALLREIDSSFIKVGDL